MNNTPSLAERIRAAKTNKKAERERIKHLTVPGLNAIMLRILDNPIPILAAIPNTYDLRLLYPGLHFWNANPDLPPYPNGTACTCINCGYIHSYVKPGEYTIEACYICNPDDVFTIREKWHLESTSINNMLRAMPREDFDLINRLRRKPSDQ